MFRDGHEAVVEDFQHHRIGARADRFARGQRNGAAHDDMIERCDAGLPAGLDDDRLVRFDDEGRTHDFMPRLQRLAHEDGRIHPVAAGTNLPPVMNFRGARDDVAPWCGGGGSAAVFCDDLDRLHDNFFFVEAEAELCAMRHLEPRRSFQAVETGKIDLQGCVASLVTQMKYGRCDDVRFGDALRRKLTSCLFRQFRNSAPQVRKGRLVEAADNRARLGGGDARKPDAIG